MKSIMISIKPKWVAKILNGEKTIEIRKSHPKCELPITVYIYCTKNKGNLYRHFKGEFMILEETRKECLWNGKVVAKFTLNKVEKIEIEWHDENHFYYTYRTKDLKYRDFFAKSGLFLGELETYIDNRKSYAWHIDNLEIFENPLPLQPYFDLDSPPQSWQYIENAKRKIGVGE